MKTCVVYYSYEGNTKCIAETLAKEINCDIFELKAAKELSSKGLMKYVWGGKQAMMKDCPKLQTLDFNPDDYDCIFLGTPIWAWTVAPVVRSFIQTYLRKRYVYIFYTHEGGDQGFYEKVETLVNENNRLIGVRGFINVLKNKDVCTSLCLDWSKDVKGLFNL